MEISLNHPQVGKGHVMTVGPWAIPNGGSIEVDDEKVQAYINSHPNFYRDSKVVTFSGNLTRPPRESAESMTPSEDATPVEHSDENNPLDELGGGEH